MGIAVAAKARRVMRLICVSISVVVCVLFCFG